MKVKEVIAALSKLDQEKELWVIYDGCKALKPIPDEIQKEQEDYYPDVTLNVGDYVITAG
jgi:hypothetical protein